MELVFSFYFCSVLISEISLLISSFLGSKPRALRATFSYFISITPEPSESNRSNASLISFFCFSVSSCLKVSLVFPFLTGFFYLSLFIFQTYFKIIIVTFHFLKISFKNITKIYEINVFKWFMDSTFRVTPTCFTPAYILPHSIIIYFI